jgi:hypothetical protein
MHPQILMAEPEGPLVHKVGKIAYDYSFGPASAYHQNCLKIENEDLQRKLKHLCYTSVFGLELGFIYNPLYIRKYNSAFFQGRRFKFWGVKAFPNQQSADGLLWMYPQAKFIYLFRNGLDVVYSMTKFASFESFDFSEKCRFWSDRVFRYEYLRHHDRALTVRFEDFLNNTEQIFKNIYEHLGLSPNPKPVEYASSTLVHSLNHPTKKISPVKEFAHRKNAYAEWDDAQKFTFKKLCSKAMEKLCYEIPF